MKKFKYKIAFDAGSIDKRDLIFAELKQLGYLESDVANGTVAATGYHSPHVMTSFSSYSYGERELISDKDTFLALAAMVDDDKFYKGEWVVCKTGSISKFSFGKLYKVIRGNMPHDPFVIVEWDDEGNNNGLHYESFRKATKEEIINHFKGGKVKSTAVAIDTETAPLNAKYTSKSLLKNYFNPIPPAEILSGKSWYDATESKFYDDRIYATGLTFQTSKPHDTGFVTLPKSGITFITKPRPKKHKLLTF